MGKLAEIKTRSTSFDVDSFINSIADEQKRKDSHIILNMMEKAIGKAENVGQFNHRFWECKIEECR